MPENKFVRIRVWPITTASSEPEPDVSVVRGASEDYRERHPMTAKFVE